MCLMIDDRERDRIDEEVRRLGVEAEVTRLEFGDCAFAGRGPGGSTVMVGCERKKLSDLINSMRDKRLSGLQLRGMWTTYDYVYLFTEGTWRPGPGGTIEESVRYWDREDKCNKWGWRPAYKQGNVGDRAAISYSQIMGYLTGLELRGNVIWRRSRDVSETAAQYVALYRNFNEKGWDDHHSHDVLYCGDVPIKGHGGGWAEEHGHEEDYRKAGRGKVMISQEPPNTLWRMAAQLPGMDRRAAIVAKHFGTVRAMANATEKEWKDIDFGVTADGRKKPGVGDKTSAAVVRAITEVGG